MLRKRYLVAVLILCVTLFVLYGLSRQGVFKEFLVDLSISVIDPLNQPMPYSTSSDSSDFEPLDPVKITEDSGVVTVSLTAASGDVLYNPYVLITNADTSERVLSSEIECGGEPLVVNASPGIYIVEVPRAPIFSDLQTYKGVCFFGFSLGQGEGAAISIDLTPFETTTPTRDSILAYANHKLRTYEIYMDICMDALVVDELTELASIARCEIKIEKMKEVIARLDAMTEPSVEELAECYSDIRLIENFVSQ